MRLYNTTHFKERQLLFYCQSDFSFYFQGRVVRQRANYNLATEIDHDVNRNDGSKMLQFDDYDAFSKLYIDTNTDFKDENVTQYPRLENLNIEEFQYYPIQRFNTCFNQNTVTESDLKLINLNVRGLNRNYDNIVTYLNSFLLKFDIIVLSECHLQVEHTTQDLHNKYPLEGYEFF